MMDKSVGIGNKGGWWDKKVRNKVIKGEWWEKSVWIGNKKGMMG